MSSTIETSHTNFMLKCQYIKDGIEVLKQVIRKYGKFSDCPYIIRCADMDFEEQVVDDILTNYKIAIISELKEYYSSSGKNTSGTGGSDVTSSCTNSEDKATIEYYKKLTSGNYISKLNGVIASITNIINIIQKYCKTTGKNSLWSKITNAERLMTNADSIRLSTMLKRTDYKTCSCGTKMLPIMETSELCCQNPLCGKTKYMTGVIFKDDLAGSQEGSKTKHGGYDFNRHYKFWVERLQANEHKNFTQEEISALEYCKHRDRIRDVELRCSHIRDYLQETGMTEYNDHAPLLVKLLGGTPPPQFDFQENRDMSITFNKIINLYHKVNPDGSNRPYYPYFIYKMVERKFANNPDKLRLLDYIHLQSGDTVKKNDYYYEQICALSAPEDDLVYTPTNPYERGNLDRY